MENWSSRYKDLHLWMILPLLMMQVGIFKDYWGDLISNSWSTHIHYWTGTIWYSYLIVQPFYATHGRLVTHRTNGIIGIFFAGGVCFSALSMMHRDMELAQIAIDSPGKFGPFQYWFFYGIAAVEIVMMGAFAFAIMRSIIVRKDPDNHAWWLASSAFMVMMPALSRGVGYVYYSYLSTNPQSEPITAPLLITQCSIILALLLTAWKFKRITHPATMLALAVNVFVMFLEPIGRSSFLQQSLRLLIKG